MYTNTLRFIVQFLLTLTPTLWAPREWVATLSASLSEQPVYIDDETMKAWSRLDSDGRCKTWAEKKEAILDPAASASGWYGPGAYLAWLITAYVTALSTIWHSKCSRQHPDDVRSTPEWLLLRLS